MVSVGAGAGTDGDVLTDGFVTDGIVTGGVGGFSPMRT